MGAGAFSPWEFCSVKLTISDLEPDEEGAWDGYVTEHPAATMFHRAGWRRVIAADLWSSDPLPARPARRQPVRRVAVGRGPEPIVRAFNGLRRILRLWRHRGQRR